jgi:hypothetical protein
MSNAFKAKITSHIAKLTRRSYEFLRAVKRRIYGISPPNHRISYLLTRVCAILAILSLCGAGLCFFQSRVVDTPANTTTVEYGTAIIDLPIESLSKQVRDQAMLNYSISVTNGSQVTNTRVDLKMILVLPDSWDSQVKFSNISVTFPNAIGFSISPYALVSKIELKANDSSCRYWTGSDSLVFQTAGIPIVTVTMNAQTPKYAVDNPYFTQASFTTPIGSSEDVAAALMQVAQINQGNLNLILSCVVLFLTFVQVSIAFYEISKGKMDPDNKKNEKNPSV